MKNSFKYIVSTAFAMALVLFVACGKESVANPTSGRVRFYNAVSDAPAAGMDLVIDGAITNLRNWLTPSTPLADSTFKYRAGFPVVTDSVYFYMTEGTHNVKLTSLVGGTTTALNLDMTVAAGGTYTVFATDTLSKVSAVISTDVIGAPVSKKASFRFAHMIPDGPAVDIARVRGTDTTLIFTNITYKTVTPFVSVDTSVGTTGPFKTDYLVRPAGTKTSVTAANWTAAVFANGRVYTLVATGLLGKSTVNKSLLTNAR